MNGRGQVSRQHHSTYYGMGTRYDGSAVRKTELPAYSPNVRIKKSPKPQKKQGKAQSAKKNAASARSRFLTIFSILLVTFAAFMVLCRGLVITESTNRIEKKEKELSDTIATNEKIKMEIEHSLDLKTVEEAATNRLGMRQPEKYQTIYVNLEQVDHVEKISTSVGGRLKAVFQKVKEYLD